MRLIDFLRPKWRHSDPVVRAEAVRALKDKAILSHLALHDEAPSVRASAVQAIEDQSLISALATRDPSPQVRLVALARVEDQTVLGHLAKTDPDGDVRFAAAERLSDNALAQEIFAHLATHKSRGERPYREESTRRLRQNAVGRLTSRELLARVADAALLDETLIDQETLLAALLRLQDQRALTKLARKAKPDVWSTMLRVLERPAWLAAVAVERRDWRQVAAFGETACEALAEVIHRSFYEFPPRVNPWEIKAAAAKVLMEIGGPGSVVPLIAYLPATLEILKICRRLDEIDPSWTRRPDAQQSLDRFLSHVWRWIDDDPARKLFERIDPRWQERPSARESVKRGLEDLIGDYLNLSAISEALFRAAEICADATAVEVLAKLVAEDSDCSKWAERALYHVLLRTSGSATTADLERLADLPDQVDFKSWVTDEDLGSRVLTGSEKVDLSAIKELAREEMSRRGADNRE